MVTGPLTESGALLEHEGRRYRIEAIRPEPALPEVVASEPGLHEQVVTDTELGGAPRSDAALSGRRPIHAADGQWHSSWVIRDADGRTAGSIVVLAKEGESGDPVYGGIHIGDTDTSLEGSDWAGIALALINTAEGRGLHTREPRG